MKIAFILPSLAQRGPILVVKDIVTQIHERADVDVYYFDDIVEVKFDCPVYKINFSTKIDFDKYDIIHSHSYRPDKYIWCNRKKIRGKTISTIHCDIRKDLRYSYNVFVSLIFRWVWLTFIKSHDKVVTLTKSILNSYYKKYISLDKLLCIYNGRMLLDIEAVSEDDKKWIKLLKLKKYKIMGSNSLLIKRKGLHYVIKILTLLPDYVFIILGEGKEKNNLLNLAIKNGVSDRCYFLGYKRNAVAYLNYYDVYVMPSVSEGFSLALLEAAFLRKSCVCSDIEIFREIYSENEVTFCNPRKALSFKNAIEEAYLKRIEKGEKIYERTNRDYTVEMMGNNYYKLYMSVLS